MNNEPAYAQTKTTQFGNQVIPKPERGQIATCPRRTEWVRVAACDVRPSTRAPKATPKCGS
eukprot:11268262-Alexandrium_andersonii.AAC.1